MLPMRIAAGLVIAVFLGISLGIATSRDGTHTLLLLLIAEHLLFAVIGVWVARRVDEGKGHLAVRVHFPRLSWILLLSFGCTLMVGVFITGHYAGGDEAAYLFQSRIFAHGGLAADAPPDILLDGQSLRQIFRFHHHVISQDKWYTIYPPLWPVLLGLWTAAAPEWLLNPLLSVGYLFLVYRVGSLLYDPLTATVAVACIALSLNFQHQSSGMLSHPSCAVLLTGAVLCFLRGRCSRMLVHFTLAWLLLAAAGYIRPYTAACVGVVLIIGMVVEVNGTRRLCFPFAMIGVTISLIAAVGYVAYNRALSGVTAGYPGWSTEELFARGPTDLLRILASNTRWSLESTMFYGVPFLIPLAVVAVVRDRSNRFATVILGMLFSIVVCGYSVTDLRSGDVYFGERYYYETFYALCLLSARGLVLLGSTGSRSLLRHTVPVGLLVVGVYALHATVYVQRAVHIFQWRAAVSDGARSVREAGSVVFLPSPLGRDTNLNAADWRHAPQIYVEDPGEHLRAPVMRALDRRVGVIVSYDKATHRALRTRLSF